MPSYLIIDVDDSSTTAILIEGSTGRYEVKGVGTAATTLEPPDLDVTIGVKDAIKQLEQVVGSRQFHLNGSGKTRVSGVDFFLCSSSAAGLHMAVAGLVWRMSAESARRAALGAGAFLIEGFAVDDGRLPHERVMLLRSLRPDIFLLAGGTDGGNVTHVPEMAELLRVSDLKPRFGDAFKLPIIYAGNVQIRKEVAAILHEDQFALQMVENVRPLLETENLTPAKQAIYDAFMKHVIVHSPGYDKLVKWIDKPLVPTQSVIGEILYAYANDHDANLIGVDIGGATTDIYSTFHGIFTRTLKADFGMTYGIGNILKEAGVLNVMRWIPIEMEENEVRNMIGNMMIHQTTPNSPEALLVQHAVAREALRLGVEHHKTLASRLKGVKVERTIADMFQQAVKDTHVDLMTVDLLVGRGQVLSNAPKLGQAALILLDSLQLEGITEILLDTAGILPHLGMLQKVNREAALALMASGGLFRLGTCIAPKGNAKVGDTVMRVKLRKSDGTVREETIPFGKLRTLPLDMGTSAEVETLPTRGFDVGNGKGKRLTSRVIGGALGVIIDTRGRPIRLPATKKPISQWAQALDAYPAIFGGQGAGGA
jgi:uncharacterized protein (TIGR01319 family)